MSNIKGYKVFNSDWTCRGFQYKVGETFKHEGDIELCKEGFHFCQKASDCFNYYSFDSNNKVAEVLATGLTKTGDKKTVTNEIKIIREISWQELLTIVNEGENCTGLCNTGDRNTGNYNTGNWNVGDYSTGNCNAGNYNIGDRNTGNRNVGNYNVGNRNIGDCNVGSRNIGSKNTGDWNIGNWNTGDCSAGNLNTGNWNIGNRNTGDCNAGNYNTGDWNTCNYSTGIFNTKQKNIYMFNKPSNWTLEDWINSDTRKLLNWNFEPSVWIYEENMTAEEKKEHPEYKTTRGYLKEFEFKEACKNMWDNLTHKEKSTIVTELPNFDSDIFHDITGIEIEKQIMEYIKENKKQIQKTDKASFQIRIYDDATGKAAYQYLTGDELLEICKQLGIRLEFL